MSQIQQNIKSIGDSISRMNSTQNRRFDAEQLKNFYYKNELQKMQEALDELNVSEQPYDSPLREDTRNEELQRLVLQNTSNFDLQNEDIQEESNRNQISDTVDELIQPKYNRKLINQFMNVETKQPEIPKITKIQKISPQRIVVLKKGTKEAYKSPNDKKTKITKSQPKNVSEHFKVRIQMEQQKENIVTTRLDNKTLIHMQQRKELESRVKSVKQASRKQMQGPIIKQQSTLNYHPRGLKDQAELELYGRVLPCQDCALHLSNGLSSDNCRYHGKLTMHVNPSQQLPKRFQKYL